MADARTRSGRHITARLGAQTPGARTTRFCRTRTAPVVRAPLNRSRETRPAIACAPMPPRPPPPRPRIVTIAKRPLSLGRDERQDTIFPNFGQSESFLRGYLVLAA